MGEMIPDLSKEVAHLLESPDAYNAAGAAAASVVGVAVAGRVERNRGSRDIHFINLSSCLCICSTWNRGGQGSWLCSISFWC
ncbi:hypothetical protein T459_27583 [Capsicum annuum]|uniref:Uncharacterized protein n=1 Tax=Capsicum annuum TaxID=4072 RepID=A0A2G2YEC7_CAPAN|nr:hypothetical protein T459_27583 [Capsicum annuum]